MKKDQSFVDLYVTSSGTIVFLKSHAFVVSCNDSTIETPVDGVHERPCSACTVIPLIPDDEGDEFPNIFISSPGVVSSWAYNIGKYQLVSVLRTSRKRVTSMYSCSNSLALASGNTVDVVAVANNAGMSHFVEIIHKLPVQSLEILSNDGDDLTLISTCGSDVFIWDLIKQTCIFKSPIATMSIRGKQALLSARYDSVLERGFIGHYCNDEFQLLTFRKMKDNCNKYENIITMEKKSHIQNLETSHHSLALNFVNDNERLCVLATQSDISIIDSLQKCVVKKIKVESLLPSNAIQVGSIPTLSNDCAIASAQFPYICVYLNTTQLLFQHKLDAAFALAAGFMNSEEPNQNFKPLMMSDQAAIHRLNAKLDSGSTRKERKSIGDKTRRPIESSGYCRIQESRLGQCPSNLKIQSKLNASKAKIAKKRRNERKQTALYPINAHTIDLHQEEHDDTEIHCLLPPLAAISFDSFGEHLAVSTADKGLHVIKLPLSKHGSGSKQIGKSHPSVGERRIPPPSSCRPSWSVLPGKRMIAFDNRVFQLSASMKSMTETRDLGNKSTNACFCFKDRILIYTQKSTLFLMPSPSQLLDETQQKNNNFHHILSYEPAQRITSVASVNAVETNIIALSCSDKSLRIVDIETGKSLWSQDYVAGSRAANYITFPSVTDNIPISSDNFNILLATSSDEGGLANIWDMRCGELVKSFQGHSNRRDQCLGSFSPCMRYIGVGGEGNCGSATLYDIRGKGKNPRIQCNLGKNKEGVPFRDGSVIDIQFHPLYSQVVTSSLAGKLRWYREEILSS